MNENIVQTILKIVKHFENDNKINTLDKITSLLQVLENFSEPNRILVLRCFIEAAKVIHSRQNTLQKSQLKMKEIRSALELIIFHYDKSSVSQAKNKPLSDFLGIELTEDMAIEYYEKHVEGEIVDYYHRKIILTEDGIKHLYKDATGEHKIESQYFQIYRAKRLPWIKHTLSNTQEIYKKKEGAWIIYAYVQYFQVPTNVNNVPNYLVVIVRSESQQAPLKFITAYYLDNYENLLKKIEEFEPYHGPKN